MTSSTAPVPRPRRRPLTAAGTGTGVGVGGSGVEVGSSGVSVRVGARSSGVPACAGVLVAVWTIPPVFPTGVSMAVGCAGVGGTRVAVDRRLVPAEVLALPGPAAAVCQGMNATNKAIRMTSRTVFLFIHWISCPDCTLHPPAARRKPTGVPRLFPVNPAPSNLKTGKKRPEGSRQNIISFATLRDDGCKHGSAAIYDVCGEDAWLTCLMAGRRPGYPWRSPGGIASARPSGGCIRNLQCRCRGFPPAGWSHPG